MSQDTTLTSITCGQIISGSSAVASVGLTESHRRTGRLPQPIEGMTRREGVLERCTKGRYASKRSQMSSKSPTSLTRALHQREANLSVNYQIWQTSNAPKFSSRSRTRPSENPDCAAGRMDKKFEAVRHPWKDRMIAVNRTA